jgi:uncharacterized membrane protein
MRKFIKNQTTFLLFGFVFWLPIMVLILILIFLFGNIEDIGRKVLLFFLPEDYYHVGYGIISFIIVVYLSGVILKLTRIKKVFSKIPILGLLFGEGEVITIERLIHLTPCLFLLSPSCPSYGWILSEEHVKVGKENAGFTLMNVYYPNVPSLVTGQVFPVRKSTVIKLGNPSKEIIDLLLYAFRSPQDLIYLPWKDESFEEFETRSESFGINLYHKYS